jgi:hypothetical protein
MGIFALPNGTRLHARSGSMTEITVDETRWTEALTIERTHGDGAVDWVVARIVDLASCGDGAGVAHFMEIIDRLDKLQARGAPH